MAIVAFQSPRGTEAMIYSRALTPSKGNQLKSKRQKVKEERERKGVFLMLLLCFLLLTKWCFLYLFN